MQLKVTVNGVEYQVEVEVEEEPAPTLGAIFMSGGSFTSAPTHVQTPAASSNGVQAPAVRHGRAGAGRGGPGASRRVTCWSCSRR